jgi:cytochrome c oxidase subunit 2
MPVLLAGGLVVATFGVPIARGALKDGGPSVRTFEMTASRFKFDPQLIEVAEGDEVRLVLRSADGLHGFAIKELKVKVKIPKGGEPVSATFVARRAGTFEILCSEYCGLGHRDMKARLVVATPRTR